MWILEPINNFTEPDAATEPTKIGETSNLPTSMDRLETTIYPNPVHAEATVIFSEAAAIKNIQLYNTTGQQFKVEWEQPQSTLCQLHLETHCY